MQDCGCDLESRIQVISGDISRAGFGLSAEDEK